jgi:large-conductance mechanosensitive channel
MHVYLYTVVKVIHAGVSTFNFKKTLSSIVLEFIQSVINFKWSFEVSFYYFLLIVPITRNRKRKKKKTLPKETSE